MRKACLACAVVTVVGCGGGGGGITDSGGGTPQSAGALLVNSSGNTPKAPVVIPTRNAVITGFAGANYTNAVVNLPAYNDLPTVDQQRNRRLIVSMACSPMEYDFSTYRLRNLAPDIPNWLDGTGFVHLSANGAKMVYRRYLQGTGYQVVVANSDGTDPVVYSTIPTVTSAALSPDGKRVYFVQSGVLKYVGSPTGAPVTVATGLGGSTGDIYDVSADGTRLLLSTGLNSAFMVDTSGGVTSLGSSAIYGAAFNQAGSQFCYNLDFAGSNGLAQRSIPGSTGGLFYSDSDAFFRHVARVPDNISWLVTRIEATKTAFYTVDSIRQSLQEVYSVGLGNQAYDAQFAPYVQTRKVVGNGSTVTTGASAILYSQLGSSFGSFVAVDAIDRSLTTVISADDYNPNQSLAVATITAGTANTLKNVIYINRLGDTKKQISATDAVGVIVTFNSDTGQVVTILPYKGSKSAAKSSRIAGGMRFTGEFTGAYDADGKNLAPGGTSAVQVSDDGVVTLG